jgi:hypothetical protein
MTASLPEQRYLELRAARLHHSDRPASPADGPAVRPAGTMPAAGRPRTGGEQPDGRPVKSATAAPDFATIILA